MHLVQSHSGPKYFPATLLVRIVIIRFFVAVAILFFNKEKKKIKSHLALIYLLILQVALQL